MYLAPINLKLVSLQLLHSLLPDDTINTIDLLIGRDTQGLL